MGAWITSLAINNLWDTTNIIMVACYDQDGVTTGTGTWSFSAFEMWPATLYSYIDSGYVPTTGSLAIYGTEPFLVDKFTMNITGGLGEVEKQSEPF